MGWGTRALQLPCNSGLSCVQFAGNSLLQVRSRRMSQDSGIISVFHAPWTVLF